LNKIVKESLNEGIQDMKKLLSDLLREKIITVTNNQQKSNQKHKIHEEDDEKVSVNNLHNENINELSNRSWENGRLLLQILQGKHKFSREFHKAMCELKKTNLPQVTTSSDRCNEILKEIVGCLNSELVHN